MLELQVLHSRTRDMIKAFALGDTDELIVGREEECDICIKSQSISREHCAIEQNGQDTWIRDLESTGGTYLDGERVDEMRIVDGMEFSVGPAILKFIESGI